MEIVEGNLVLTAPDGTQTFVRKAKLMVKISKNG
jgi:hypothetical protein